MLRVCKSHVTQGKNGDSLKILWYGFTHGAVPGIAIVAIIMFGFWFALLGLVPACLPQPWPPIIIWSVIIALMIPAYFVEYQRTH